MNQLRIKSYILKKVIRWAAVPRRTGWNLYLAGSKFENKVQEMVIKLV